MQPRDGGPAFPGKTSPKASDARQIRDELGIGLYDAKELLSYSGGMSLRDYAAIHTDISKVNFPDLETVADYAGATVPDDYLGMLRVAIKAQAKIRYEMADAMLAAREVRS